MKITFSDWSDTNTVYVYSGNCITKPHSSSGIFLEWRHPHCVVRIIGIFVVVVVVVPCSSGFGGLVVACWPLVPKIAGSLPAEAVGFFRQKNPQRAFLQKGSKAVCPMS
jgi:hypothetical protein